jgi:hypothetical protein
MSLKSHVLTALAVVAVILPVRLQAQDQQSCSNNMLHGSYGLHATGVVIDVGEFAAVDRFVFDGRGNLTGQLFARVDGNNSQRTLTGTYSVSPDCIVTDVWHFSDGTSSTHTSIIVNEGKEYVILNTTEDEPNVISGKAERQ